MAVVIVDLVDIECYMKAVHAVEPIVSHPNSATNIALGNSRIVPPVLVPTVACTLGPLVAKNPYQPGMPFP